MAKNILILGGGGREHAIAKALKSSKNIKHVSCAPGNPGITKDASCHLSDPMDLRSVLELAGRLKPDLVVVGPEAPLAAGIADALIRHQYVVFGPNQRSAQLESSKIFSKNFMKRHGIPTAEFDVYQSNDDFLNIQKSLPCVVKADGLAAGKGVRICKTESDLKDAQQDFLIKKILGPAGEKGLIEKFLDGSEMSVLALVSGEDFELLPVAQDYKRLLNDNKGPNTGGMGSYAPVQVPQKLLSKIKEKIIIPTMKGLKEERLDYRGVLYFGLMIQDNEPYLLEYNVRFGDPETQVILPLLDGDWADVFSKVASGKVPKLKWKNMTAVCVVLAAPGYPDNPQKGLRLVIDKNISSKANETNYYLHAGTASHNGYITSGGRVINVVCINKNGPTARSKAYELVSGIILDGMIFRTDIGLELGTLPAPKAKKIIESVKKQPKGKSKTKAKTAKKSVKKKKRS